MAEVVRFENEPLANSARTLVSEHEPISQRTYTPTQAVIARSAGIFHFTPDGRRLADFTSGVLVANLGHNPRAWLRRFWHYLGWRPGHVVGEGYAELAPLTTYNAISTLEVEANRRLLASLRRSPGGKRMEQILWSASGSEGIQKALWSALAFQPAKELILATRHGFHGKKGLAEAVTGDERSPNRDPRVIFISFPKAECYSVNRRDLPFDPTPYCRELEALAQQHRGKLNCLITEPYLGGGGSFHPPKAYLALLERFCREHGLLFILDEVQSNFGRTGSMYAFESYGIEPDLVVLGKGMGNGVPANAVAGRRDVLASLSFGAASDTWSGHPLGCAATLATLDLFETSNVLDQAQAVSEIAREELLKLENLPIVAAVRGEGMVWGVELADVAGKSANEIASACIRAAYVGDENGNAIHLLGPLAGNVLRVSPPLVMTSEEARFWFGVLGRILSAVSRKFADVKSPTLSKC